LISLLVFSKLHESQASRFLVVGALGNFLGWGFYALAYQAVPVVAYKPTISWVISFHLGVIVQHHLHRFYTFQTTFIPYVRSLFRSYISYLGVFIYGLIFNFTFNEFLNIYHHYSFAFTLIVSIPFSYLILGKFAFEKSGQGP
jgi:putative flippase GtrA